eukprot:CAMPEP_0197289484 /NCGR_PEP_ID=MMETSP0890-20130614/6764_1 /TAXON_ID=44058 ORGANISM="Aureoumbra lagunensis, Strain CCMP1510" /NCGR_SAMPLE_ID=MMETSP0890 /ASSEMBLY_ACC=CAM_ASM_000533 /LENGTH=218 /DNA_ID=CAMNT_0042760943 /DNA_START=377 /DNA_END=1033 /DNA_ORIENTATION=-
MPQGEALPVVGGLIAVNCGVYAMWQSGTPHNFMVDHFTLSSRSVLSKPHTLLTSMFSHNDGYHLLGNMITLFFFGPEVVYAIGARAFLGLYGGAGIVSSICQIANDMSRNARMSYFRVTQRYLGASGAVNAAVAWSILANPWRLIIVFAEILPIPLPAILYGGFYIGKDVAALINVHLPYISDRGAGVAHGAHVAGAACGVAHFLLFRRPPRGGMRRY